MARISGVDIPREKRLVVSLTYIFGVGDTIAKQVCEATGIDANTRVRDLIGEAHALSIVGPELNRRVFRMIGLHLKRDLRKSLDECDRAADVRLGRLHFG